MRKTSFYLTAACILLIPRILRYLYPELYIEDDFYMQNAFLMTLGERPYHDFILNHFPLLELLLKSAFDIFGVSIQTAEVMNHLFVVLNAIMLLMLGLKLKNRATGLAASFLYSCSALIFKYHIFEREIFTGTCILAGICCYVFIKKERQIKYLLIGTIFLVSALIKFTGALPLITIAGVTLYERKFKETASLFVSFGMLFVAAALFCYAHYGQSFYFQVFLFHFLKGSRSFLGRAQVFIRSTDVSLFFGALGFLFHKGTAFRKEWAMIKLMFLTYPAFFLFFSSTVWSHNVIDMLPFACLLGGAYIATISKVIADFFSRRASVFPLSARNNCYLIFVVILFFTVKPWQTDDSYTQQTVYGFGNIPRKEILELGHYIASKTMPDDFIFCPFPVLSVSSRRRTIVNYWENAGVYTWARENSEREGIRKTIAKAKAMNFMDLIEYTKSHAYTIFWREAQYRHIPLLVKTNKAHALISFRPQEHAKQLLDYCSGERLLSKEHFEVFTFIKKNSAHVK